MKTKLLIFLLFISAMSAEAVKFKISISGGTANHTYYSTELTNTSLTCKGNGHNGCFGLHSNLMGGSLSGVYYPLGELTNYVFKQVQQGSTRGDEKYENDMPLRWISKEGGNLEIEIEVKEVKYGE